MKTKLTIAALAAAIIITGCAGGPQTQEACNTLKAAYELYLFERDTRPEPPSEEEIRWARLTAALLTARCGWKPPAVRGLEPAEDRYGVPILTPP